MSLDRDLFLDQSAVIRHPDRCEFGKHIAIDHGFYCTTSLDISDYVHIGPYVCVIGGKDSKLTVNEFCTIAAGTKIICSSDDPHGRGLFGPPSIPTQYRNAKHNGEVKVERFVSLGVNCVIMPGVTLAEGSLIAANTMIRKNTEPWTVYFGPLGKKLRRRDPGDRHEYARLLGYE